MAKNGVIYRRFTEVLAVDVYTRRDKNRFDCPMVAFTQYPMLQSTEFRCDDKMNRAAVSCRVSELGDEIGLEGVTPEWFYRGSSSKPAWIPV